MIHVNAMVILSGSFVANSDVLAFQFGKSTSRGKREKGRCQDEALNWGNYLLRKLINQTSLPLFINI